MFGVSGNGTGDRTVCGTAGVLDGLWHHVAVQRRRSDGWMWLFVDGALQSQADGPDGDVSYPDDGVPGSYCGGPCTNSDPFLVIAAEKHDAGAAFPSYSGWVDEVRLSTVIRYTANFTRPTQPFTTDAATAALYHFDEGSGTTLTDSSGAAGGPSPGVIKYGGAPFGPVWSTDTPFGTTTPTDLLITKAGPTSVTPGQNVIYTITVTNNGLANAGAVQVSDPTPAGLAFLSNAGSCTTAFPCSLGTVGAGENRTITATFRVSSGYSGPSPIQNTAGVSSTTPDPNPANNSATAGTAVDPPSADLALAKTGPMSFSPAATLAYTLQVTNNGPSDAAGVQLDDPTPTGLSFVSNSGSCATAFPCSLGTVPAGQTRTITATFAVPSGYGGPDPIVNAASVTTSTADPVPASDSAQVSTPRSVATSFYTATPCRVVDTRNASGPWGGPALSAGATRIFTITGRCGIPATARAVSANVAVTEPTAAGNLRLYPEGPAVPLASTINYAAGQTRANNAVVPLSAGGTIDVRCFQGFGTVHFILDVSGWFE